MFPMTLTVHNARQLNAVLAALQPDLEASDFKDPTVGQAYVEARDRVANNEKTAKESPKGEVQTAPATTAPKPEKSAASSRTAEAPAAAPSPKAESSAPVADKAPTYDDVKKAILEVSKAKGRDSAIGLLKEFGAENGPALKPEQYATFLAKAKAQLS